ncbi:MAG: [NiFe]-hydrogenase assembly chaperone HybE [Rubrivivax sp.]|nr:[NiFe]-hydrogenase assembly chaperone HybE [Rubrivivax sp.]
MAEAHVPQPGRRPAALSTADQARVQALVDRFRHIEITRMADVPMRHPGLQVAAVGFAADDSLAAPDAGDLAAGQGGLVGILVTSWFMNLMWLPPSAPTGSAPVAPAATPQARPGPAAGGVGTAAGSVGAAGPVPAPLPTLRVGDIRARRIGTQSFDFIGAEEDGIGCYEACSLFSPMFEFADQEAALATAQAVMDLLQAPPPPAQPAAVPAPRADQAAPGRRGFLFGRSAA